MELGGFQVEPTPTWIFFWWRAIAKMSREGGESTGPVGLVLDKRVRFRL
jgi:hypothetical protein